MEKMNPLLWCLLSSLQQSSSLSFVSILTLQLASQMTKMATDREVPELRVVQNTESALIFTERRGRKVHVSSLSITYSRELRAANPLTWSPLVLQK
jgi:hypothetical protein